LLWPLLQFESAHARRDGARCDDSYFYTAASQLDYIFDELAYDGSIGFVLARGQHIATYFNH
tara:strand:+ start:32 stop:217 length:186 start_codon:yes stop_codon:yes gene_type:complete